MQPVGRYQKGFGLIEVLIAIAIIAGGALVVATFISSGTSKQVAVRGKSECTAALSSILSKMKETDNNSVITNWLPKANEGIPSGNDRYLQTRMSRMIFSGYTDGSAVIQSTLLSASAGMTMDGAYTTDETNLRLQANNYQLIYSTSSMLAHYYRTIPNICNGADIDRDGDDYLSRITSDVDSNSNISLKINLAGGTPGSCPAWDPVPQGVQGNLSAITGFQVSLTLSYPTENGTESCTANADFYVGTDLQAPQLQPQLISAVTGFNEVTAIPSGRVFCGPAANPSLTFNVAQVAGSEQPGTQYLCRLDFEARNATSGTVIHPFRTTGWFQCSIPTAPIQALPLPGGSNLSVGSVSVADANAPSSVQFVVSGWVEGSYKFHVKAIDIGRNETLRSQKFFVDTFRPTLAISPPATITSIADASIQSSLDTNINSLPAIATGLVSSANVANMQAAITTSLNNDLFQCSDRSFQRWAISNEEMVEVTTATIIENYHTGNMPIAMTCTAASENIPTTDWSADGPHMIQAVACDLCGTAPQVNRTWYVDTNASYTFVAPGNLSSPASNTSRFTYNAGSNDQNPYALLHEVYNNRNITAHKYTGTAVVFPFQNGILGDCSVNQRGRYCYYAADGCGRVTASPSYTYQLGAGGGSTYFCPTFSCVEPAVSNACPPTRSISCDCINDSNNDLNPNSARNGRYYGDPAIPGCTYEESLGSCCRPPRDCTLDDGTVVLHGASLTAYSSQTVSCGQTCSSQVRTCNDGVLSGSSTFAYANCQAQCCPSGKTACTQGSPGCTQEANGVWCMPEVTNCPPEKPVGPYATLALCSSSAQNCQSYNSGATVFYCGETVSGTCNWVQHGSSCNEPGGCGGGMSGGGGLIFYPPGQPCTNTNENQIVQKSGCFGDDLGYQDWICSCGNTPAPTPPNCAGASSGTPTPTPVQALCWSGVAPGMSCVVNGSCATQGSTSLSKCLDAGGNIQAGYNIRCMPQANGDCTSALNLGTWQFSHPDSMGLSDDVCSFALCNTIEGQECSIGAPERVCIDSHPGTCCTDLTVCNGNHRVFECR